VLCQLIRSVSLIQRRTVSQPTGKASLTHRRSLAPTRSRNGRLKIKNMLRGYPQMLAHRPRTTDTRRGTETPSRGSLHPVGSAVSCGLSPLTKRILCDKLRDAATSKQPCADHVNQLLEAHCLSLCRRSARSGRLSGLVICGGWQGETIIPLSTDRNAGLNSRLDR